MREGEQAKSSLMERLKAAVKKSGVKLQTPAERLAEQKGIAASQKRVDEMFERQTPKRKAKLVGWKGTKKSDHKI